MFTQKFVAAVSIIGLIVLVLFVYPSIDQRINAGPSSSQQNVTAFKTMYPISVSSESVIAHYFGKDVVEKIMKQPGCVGVRMYYGKPVSGKSRIVIVGYGKNGKEMSALTLVGPDQMCPPLCE